MSDKLSVRIARGNTLDRRWIEALVEEVAALEADNQQKSKRASAFADIANELLNALRKIYAAAVGDPSGLAEFDDAALDAILEAIARLKTATKISQQR